MKSKPETELPYRWWRVKRIVQELMEVEAQTKEEAIKRATDPYSLIVIKETAVRMPPEEEP